MFFSVISFSFFEIMRLYKKKHHKKSLLINQLLVGGFNPSEKYNRQDGKSSPGRGGNTKKNETTT